MSVRSLSLAVATLFCAAFAGAAGAAVIVTNTTNVAPDGGAVHDAYDPATDTPGSGPMMSASSTDLIQGATPAVTYTGGSGSTMNELSAGESTWTDGSLATVYGQGGSGGDDIDHAAYGSVTGTVGGGDIDTFVTYDLGSPHFLSQVDVYMGWNDSGRDDSSFNLLVSSNGVDFNAVAMYDKGGDNTGQIGNPVTNLHSITDDGGGYIASGIQYVQLQFTDADNGWAGMVELDVFGRQVPEPSAIAMMGLAGLALVVARSRR